MKNLFSVFRKRRKKRFLFFSIATVVIWLVPILMRPLVERTNGVNQLIALVFVVLTALFVGHLAGQSGEAVSAEKIPLYRVFQVLGKWPCEQNTGGVSSSRKALLRDSGGEIQLFEFTDDMAHLWGVLKEGKSVTFDKRLQGGMYHTSGKDEYEVVATVF